MGDGDRYADFVSEALKLALPQAYTADSDEVAQAFRFDGAQDSDLKPPSLRSLAGR